MEGLRTRQFGLYKSVREVDFYTEELYYYYIYCYYY